jgi:hypothetical protein
MNSNDPLVHLKQECRVDTPISLNSLDLKENSNLHIDTDISINSLDESSMNVDTPISLDSIDLRQGSSMQVDTPSSLSSLDLKEETNVQADTPVSIDVSNIKQEINKEEEKQEEKPKDSIVETKKVMKEDVKTEKKNSESKEEEKTVQQTEKKKIANEASIKEEVQEKNESEKKMEEQIHKKNEEKTNTTSVPKTTESTTTANKTHNPFILPQGSGVPGKTLPSLFLPNLLVPPLPNPMNSLNLLMPNIKPDLLPNPLTPGLSNDLLMSSLNAINNSAAANSTKTTESSSTSTTKKPLISPLPTPPLANPTSAANYTQSLLLGQNKAPLNPLQNLFTNSLGDLSNFKAPIFPLNMNLLVPKLNTTIKKPIKRKISQTNSEDELSNEKNEVENLPSTTTTTVNNTNSGSRKRGKYETDEKKRNVLERNRQAALKCRQKKKQWLISLQKQIDTYTAENETLQNQAILLQEEILTLRALLLTHKPCSINKNNDIIKQTPSTPTPNYLETYL